MHNLKLPSGLKIIVEPMTGTKTVTVFVAVNTGSKNESDRERGLSHFLEHMMFKGTIKRPSALAISEELDAVGGEFNAFTDKELTVYYAKVPSHHFATALDVMSDMVLNSKLEAEEIDREKGVIIEEMNMYQDTPMRYVSDIFEELLYGDTPAGRQIICTKDSVRAFGRNNFVAYRQSQYTAPNMAVIVAGDCRSPATKAAVAAAFKKLGAAPARGRSPVKDAQTAPAIKVFNKKTDQMHLRLGVRTFGLTDPRRATLGVLSAILGGGMSSRLFINIRERQGLCYYIYADPEFFVDHGYLAIQAGLNSEQVVRAAESIGKELRRLRDEPVPAAELKKAKEYIKGKFLMGLESSDAMAGFLGRQAILLGKIETVAERLKEVEKVTERGIKELAQEIFIPQHLNLAVIGPLENGADLEKTLLKFF